MRALKSVSIDSERRVIITFLDGSTETLYPNCIWCDSEALRLLIKDLLEEKADAIVQTINDVAIATFADGADEALIKKLLVSIDPIQEGTGDPSPENVRPITGRTGLNVVRTGKNIVDDSIKRTNAAHTTITIGGGTDDYYLFLHPGTYTLSCKFADGVHYGALIKELDSSSVTIWSTAGTSTQASFTISKGGLYRLWFYRSSGAGGVSVDNISDVQLEVGSTATEYEPYKGNTYSVDWETEVGTVYGGTLDVASGKLTVDRAYIASYNGETLPSTWISDRDVYAEGTTPTTGAQVVYTLAEPVEYQLSTQDITTLLGANNIWADSGNILEVEYVADTKLYIGESQSATLGSGRQTITKPEIQHISDKTVEDLTEAVKNETQEETEVERGE